MKIIKDKGIKGINLRQDAMPKLPPSKESCQVRDKILREAGTMEKFLRSFEMFLTFELGPFLTLQRQKCRESSLFTGSVRRQDFIAMPL